ncbi:MAG: polysaccharide pyruvyl transferase family protein [Acidobacteriaceae bacterium]
MLLVRSGLTIIDRLPLGRLRPDDGIRERLKRADVLVINGEGSVHSCTSTAVYLLGSLKFAKELGLHVWIVNHSCWNCDQYIRMYDYADFIAVRDIASYGYLAQHGVSARLSADCSFLSEPKTDTQRNELLVCSGLQPPDKQLVEHWAKSLECTRIVLSNDFYPGFSVGDAVKSPSAEQSFHQFSSARFVISSSYHGCIFATIHNTPFLPVQAKGQPPKTIVAAVEAMRHHARGVRFDGPAYVKAHYKDIQLTMLKRTKTLRQRASFNTPG